MRQSSKVEGTKIAQAAKDLNVTSVTIRRYLTEFNIDTMSDENGIKVLPDQAMEELKEIRRLKEDGLTNPKVLEILEENRAKPKVDKSESKAARAKAKPVAAVKNAKTAKVVEVEEEEEEEAPKVEKRRATRRITKIEPEVQELEAEPVAEETSESENDNEGDNENENESSGDGQEAQSDGRSKHSLTCQTCGKVFEHTNPRLRDCLDCYRAKRKERRRGGSERHKNVIQHPLAQQVVSKANASNQLQQDAPAQQQSFLPPTPPPQRERERERERAPMQAPAAVAASYAPPVVPTYVAPPVIQRAAVRNYRKAIEETRQITGSLKRRLERPDLPEGERRWLEQIYAYQLILHQGWRHLADYKAATMQQGKSSSDD